MSGSKGLQRYVPRILQDSGMIASSEVAHYTHLKLVQYVKADDIDAALRRAKAEGRQEGKEYALNEAAMRAGCAAHRACCGIEADNSQGKIHGYCVVCGVPWPCETAQFFLFKADVRATQIEEGDK